MASASRESTRDRLRRSNGVARRLVRLPLDIIEGVTRTVCQRTSLVNLGTPHHHGLHSSRQRPLEPRLSLLPPEDYYFLHTFEQHYGEAHPFLYACGLALLSPETQKLGMGQGLHLDSNF